MMRIDSLHTLHLSDWWYQQN